MPEPHSERFRFVGAGIVCERSRDRLPWRAGANVLVRQVRHEGQAVGEEAMTHTVTQTKLLTSSMCVRRYLNRSDFTGYQTLVRTWRLLGVPVFSWTVAREDVQSWASIQLATLGHTEWKSRFKEFV